jgi:hypothetical protein
MGTIKSTPSESIAYLRGEKQEIFPKVLTKMKNKKEKQNGQGQDASPQANYANQQNGI